MTVSIEKGQHWAYMGESTSVVGIWLLYWVHRLLGRWPFRICVYPVVLMYWLLNPRLRAVSLQYLRRVEAATQAIGHEPGVIDSLRHVGLFAESMLDKLLAASGRYHIAGVQTEGRERLYEDAAAGRGGLMVAAHMGCLEIGRAIAEHRGTVRLNILVHTRHAVRFNRLLTRLNPDSEVNLIEVTEIGPETAVLLSDKVAKGEYVIIAGDRVPVFASQTVDVDFLGHTAPFPAGPWVLASLLRCPVWFMCCIHSDDSYMIRFVRLCDRVVLPRGAREAAIAQFAARYADEVTALLRRSPYDWFNFFPFWDQLHVERHRPDGL